MRIRIYCEPPQGMNVVELVGNWIFGGRWYWSIGTALQETNSGYARTEWGARRKAERACRKAVKKYKDYKYEYDPNGDPDVQKRSRLSEKLQTKQPGEGTSQGSCEVEGS